MYLRDICYAYETDDGTVLLMGLHFFQSNIKVVHEECVGKKYECSKLLVEMYGGKCHDTSIILSVFYSGLNLLGPSLWFAILFDLLSRSP